MAVLNERQRGPAAAIDGATLQRSGTLLRPGCAPTNARLQEIFGTLLPWINMTPRTARMMAPEGCIDGGAQ
jgi:hypothetical protein